ncbi:MAG: phosphoglycerate kinase [Thermoguttaceae bacterium]|nr:phosphoglycerate kinase [Thermoguttaceae bacterium]MDW8038744.1 phosphoglycerate kinase [Thermoguttaceae bacterium]
MKVTAEKMEKWLRGIFGVDPEVPKLSLPEYLKSIPELDSLSDVPAGTPVLVRGDTDAKPGAKIGEGDIRLRCMEETLRFGRDRGWKQIIFGHIGREPEKSLNKVRDRLAEIMQCEITFIKDWLNPDTLEILPEVPEAIQKAPPGGLIMLENVRKYEIERVLWKAKPADIAQLAPRLAKIANEFAEKVARIYVHEAFSAGSLDTSSLVIPAAMDRVAMGKYEWGQFTGPLMDCLQAELVVSSGLKIDKLDDLTAMINRGTVRWVFTGGSLAMGLKKAAAQLDGQDFCIGVQEDPAHADKPYYIPPERVEQAKRLIADGRQKGIQFIMPIDFVLQDGRVSRTIGPTDQQLDVGPETSQYYEKKVGEFLESVRGREAVAFHNGVFGMFEDPRFEEGTRRFIRQLKRMKDAGVKVYVGGGEGGTALEKYGQPDWVTHNFTAGGTVLNALGSEPVPYLVALKMAAGR